MFGKSPRPRDDLDSRADSLHGLHKLARLALRGGKQGLNVRLAAAIEAAEFVRERDGGLLEIVCGLQAPRAKLAVYVVLIKSRAL